MIALILILAAGWLAVLIAAVAWRHTHAPVQIELDNQYRRFEQ